MSAHLLSHRAPPQAGSFRERLQAELAQRCGRNARYSLRAFANFLETDHASLSQLLRGTRRTYARKTVTVLPLAFSTRLV